MKALTQDRYGTVDVPDFSPAGPCPCAEGAGGAMLEGTRGDGSDD